MRFLIAALAALLPFCVSAAPLDDYCNARGHYSAEVAASLMQGYPVDQISAVWADKPTDAELIAFRDAWWVALKAEVVAMMPAPDAYTAGTPTLVAEFVRTRCLQEGVIPTLPKSAADDLHKTASSQAVIPEHRRLMCQQALGAHYGVAFHAFHRMDRAALHARIDTRTDIPAVERSRVHALVDELFDSGMGPQEWLDGKVRQCVHGT